jgi:type I restriction enzyme S subunit
MIPEDWQISTIEKATERIIDYRGKTPRKTPFGIPLITAKIVKNGHILEPEEFISEKDYEPWMRRGAVRRGDVIITTEAPMGEIAQLDDRKVALAQRIITLRGKQNFLHNDFLRYVLQSPMLQKELRKRESGTTVTGIKQSELRKVQLPIPSYVEQEAISKMLLSMDNKTDLNQQMNKTLETIAKSIFRHWFIDFEFPNEESKPYRSSGGEMVYNEELGKEIPKGWESKPIDDIADFLNGLALQNYPPENETDVLPVIKIKELRQGVSQSTEKANPNIPKQYIVDDGDVLFSWSGSLEVVIWTSGKGALNQHLFKVTSADFPKWFYYYWILHYLPEYRRIAEGKATTMGHIQRYHLKSSLVLVPDKATLQRMNKIQGPIVEKLVQIGVESRNLSQMRDMLLPKLMSGTIRIPVEVR